MYKKYFLKFALLIPAMAGLCLCVMASTPDFSAKKKDKKDKVSAAAPVEEKVVVDKTEYDFGTIKKEGGRVSAIFTITNNTKIPIVLSEVRASCGCTTPEWTKEPIEPGKAGSVTAIYNPTGSGPFEKSVTINVSSGDKTEMMVVKIKGMVE